MIQTVNVFAVYLLSLTLLRNVKQRANRIVIVM